MKNRIPKSADYSYIKKKLYRQIALACLFSIVLVLGFLFLAVGQGFISEWAVSLLSLFLGLHYYDAVTLFNHTVRANAGLFIAILIVICFLLLCRMIVSRFMRYFDEINIGVDRLMEASSSIEMSPEIGFMERKLTAVKQTLEDREKEARLAETRKGEMLMYLAHDIRTPLTSVIGYLSLLDEAKDMPSEQKAHYTHIALLKALRLEKLVGEFFELTRSNAGAMVLEKEDIKLSFMLVQMTDELLPLFEAAGKRVRVLANEDITVYGDREKLARVFSNIFKNAAAYGEPDSEIIIKAEAGGQKTTISTENKGTIPESELAGIFEKFRRLDEARSSDTGGAGLGLAIAKEIVLAHGGHIFARSQNGTTGIIVELPFKTA